MKVLITGATGFLGSHVAEQLIEQGHEVKALVRKTSKTDFLETLGVELCVASLETGAGLGDAVADVDAVVHSAGVVKAKTAEDFHEVNAGGTERLLEATKQSDRDVRRFVYVSSLTAHGFGDDDRPRAAADVSRPVTHYGRSKLAGEQVVLAAKDELPVTIIRPPAIYGPRDSEMLAFFKIVKNRVVTFLGSADNRASLVYAPDCAHAIVLALTKDHASGRIYSVEDGRVYTQREVVGYIEEALGRRAIVKFPVPIGVVKVAAVGSELVGKITDQAMMLTRDKVNELEAQQMIYPADEIREELGWEPQIQFPEGARLSVDWYRSEGLL